MLTSAARRTTIAARPFGVRALSDARPMTRFMQYPFDKTKMEEVRAWVNDNDLVKKIRDMDGVKDVEISFCPGEGWLASRVIFNDLEDMKTFLADADGFLAEGQAQMKAHPNYDSSREPHEFKGFFLEEV